MARGMLGRNSPIQFRHCRKDALKEADVVILAGTVCDFRLGYGKVLSRKSKIISVNRDKKQLTKVFEKLKFLIKNKFNFQNSDIYWKPTLAIQADPSTFVVQLAQALKGFSGSEDWIEQLRAKDDAKEEINR